MFNVENDKKNPYNFPEKKYFDEPAIPFQIWNKLMQYYKLGVNSTHSIKIKVE